MIRLFFVSLLIIVYASAYSQGVEIGGQRWMTKNLNVSTFRNGDPLLEVTSEQQWLEAIEKEIPAYCYYNFDKSYELSYGKLYNWYAVVDYRIIAPNGWKIPSNSDFEELVLFLGRNAGIDLKSLKWLEDIYPTLEYITQVNPGFNALPGGIKLPRGTFSYLNECGSWWTCSLANNDNASSMSVCKYMGGVVSCCDKTGLNAGVSIRCLLQD